VTETAAAGELSQTYHCARDYHLFGPGPKRILSLDGGGVRGAISVAFLERIEEIFSQRQRQVVSDTLKAKELAGAGTQELAETCRKLETHKIRLADRFDLVGGTSTGAVIAGALALGYSTAQVKDFYLKLAPRIFRRPLWRVPGLQSKFDARALREEIANIVRDRTLASEDLVTGLCIVTKRIDTGSPWIVSNDPLAPYWDKQEGQTYLANKDYKLSTLVRASTAAPHYFDPEIIPITEDAQNSPQNEAVSNLATNPWLSMLVARAHALYGLFSSRGPNPKTHGLFIDGGVTPFNNPSMALMMLVVLKPYQICWPLGPDQLTFVSVGTGSSRTKLSFKELGFAGPLRLAIGALLSLMSDAEAMALAQMQWLGECPDELCAEVGDGMKG
jgi:patatin-like phospholipase/acyl hydrolase